MELGSAFIRTVPSELLLGVCKDIPGAVACKSGKWCIIIVENKLQGVSKDAHSGEKCICYWCAAHICGEAQIYYLLSKTSLAGDQMARKIQVTVPSKMENRQKIIDANVV